MDGALDREWRSALALRVGGAAVAARRLVIGSAGSCAGLPAGVTEYRGRSRGETFLGLVGYSTEYLS
jgi:hypothetical protein